MELFDQESLIAIGANLPFDGLDPVQTIAGALSEMPQEGLEIVAVSRFFRTPCFPAGAGPDYVNAAAVVRGLPTPADVLAALHRIEARHGRERQVRWGMRTLDLDLIAADAQVLPSTQGYLKWRNLPPEQQAKVAPTELILPHPRLQDRAFVLVPLNDVAPAWRHPVSGLTVAQMCAALPDQDRDAVIAL